MEKRGERRPKRQELALPKTRERQKLLPNIAGTAISGRWSSQLPNTKPWLFYRGAPGTRPWAWWKLEKYPRIRDDESEDEYLTRTKQWLPGERESFEAAETV
jgi:hypothetical protein